MSRFLVVVFTLAAGQAAGAQAVLENEEMRLELIGLKRWTIPMIQDSLRRYAPRDQLLSHACAGVLRDKLKFADASVVYHTTSAVGAPAKPYLAVTVVEPQDSALIRYRAPFRDSLPTRRGWAPALRVFESHNVAFQGAIQRPGFLSGSGRVGGADSTLRAALPLRRFLRERRTVGDRRLALATLATDGNSRNRVVAALLLSSFPESDSTWWALADALRDPNGMVNATASQVLATLARDRPRHVNWGPAAPSLRALLDGTNLFAHNAVMEVLASTHVSTALTRPLLGGGGFLVLAKLASEGPSERQAARHFLVQIAGHDLGDDPAPWRAWVRGL